MNDALRQSIDEIKLRTPIEELVRERVPGLRRQGRLWVACCPFHEERTPSFKVDPERGTWHCFGACAIGGDAIRFVERSLNVDFLEALRYLSARSGVALPDRRTESDRRDDEERERLFEVLGRAGDYYRRALFTQDGARALAYLRSRGLERATLDAFGVGYAPGGGEALVQRAASAGLELERLFAAGLARKDDSGRAYDFFRDRLMIPIRDIQGRTVGFGARRLSDEDSAGPKYVNTPETEVFRKGRLIYALDLALDHVRKSGHLILVEGYTDVMAAHQVGLRTVVAVLGTATTEDHAMLVRRTGARRVSLVFDGDEAGRRATYKALAGLLALDVTLDVVRIPGDEDPCDLLVREGRAPLERALASAVPWFDFVLGALESQPSVARARHVDQALELVARLPRALDRDAHLARLAERLEYPIASVREQFETLPERARARARAAVAARAAAPAAASHQAAPADLRVRQAFGAMIGAALLEPELVPVLAQWREQCPDEELAAILWAMCDLASRPGARVDVQSVLGHLGDHPARHRVVPMLAEAEVADSAQTLFKGAQSTLQVLQDNFRIEACKRELARADLGAEERRQVAAEAQRLLRRIKVPEPELS